MLYRLIISDIDGTFLNSEKQISPKTAEICSRLHHEKGVKLALASGRGSAGIRPVADLLDFPVFTLACNGAEIYNENGTLIYQKTLPFKDVLQIKQSVKDFNPAIETIVYAGQDWLADELTDIVEKECYVMPTAPLIGAFETLVTPDSPILKIICVGSPENTQELSCHLRSLYPQYDFYKSQSYILEIVAKGVNKASSLDILCRYCGLDITQTIAFGDGYNDTEMLAHAGLGIAMENAPEDVKRYAKKVTLSNDEDGIAHALTEIFY